MFDNKYKFHKRAIKEIKDDLIALHGRLGNIFFNKISADEAEYELENAITKLTNLYRQFGNMDESFKRRISKKFKKDFDTINNYFQEIEGKIVKKGGRIRARHGSISKSVKSTPTKDISNKIVKFKNPEGVVSNFRQETEVRRSVVNTIRKVHARIWDPISGRLDPPTKKAIYVWKFDINVLYPGENFTVTVPIEMRGGRLKGQVQEGDQVQIYGKWKWTPGEKIELAEIFNKTRRKNVKVTGSAVKVY